MNEWDIAGRLETFIRGRGISDYTSLWDLEKLLYQAGDKQLAWEMQLLMNEYQLDNTESIINFIMHLRR